MIVRLTQFDGTLPNLALRKLAHWHRSRGDDLQLARTPTPTVFEPAYACGLRRRNLHPGSPAPLVDRLLRVFHAGHRSAGLASSCMTRWRTC